jgi:signal transduction histidine kinase
MGLSIARAIVEAHGGRLVVEPANGQGARFSLTLPLAEDGDR